MNLSLHIKLEIIEYIKRTGVNKSSSTRLWHGLHHHLTRIEGTPFAHDHNQLRLFFYNSLLPDILQNKLPIPAEDVQHLCYPFLLRLYNFRVIVTERGTSAQLTQEKLKLHKLFVQYLLSDKVFNQEIWDKIHTIGRSLDAKTFYVDLNNPQIQLKRVEKNKLRKRRAPQDRPNTKKKRPCMTDGWICSKKANDPKQCNQADLRSINFQPLQDMENDCENDLPACISPEPQALISAIKQASPTIFSQNLPQELASINTKTLDHPKANESKGYEDEPILADHPTSKTTNSEAPQDAENCSINIESIDQSIYSQHLSDQSVKQLDCPEPKELNTTPTANDSKEFEDQPKLDDYSTITSQSVEDMENDCDNDLTICTSAELQEHASSIELEKPNSPIIFNHNLPQREPQELTRTNHAVAHNSNGSEYQLKLGDHRNTSSISSEPVQDADNCYSPMHVTPDSPEIIVNNTTSSADLFDECCSDDLTIANVCLPYRTNPNAPELTSANNEANNSPTVCSQKLSNRSEDQPQPVGHSYSIRTRPRPRQEAVNSFQNDSPICLSPEPRQEGISSDLHELTKPIDCIEISDDSSDDCTIEPENTRTINDLVCISPEPNEVISTKNQPKARSRRVQVAVNCETDLQGRAPSGPPTVLIGTNDHTIDSVDISEDSCSEDCTMQDGIAVHDLAMLCTNSKQQISINNNTIDLTEISDDSNCSVDLPISYSMYDFCDDNVE